MDNQRLKSECFMYIVTPYKETLRRAPAALWWPWAILASSDAPTCRAQLKKVTLGEWAPMLTSDVSGDAVLSSLRKIKIPWDLGIGATNIGWSGFGPHIGSRKSGTNPGKASAVLCSAARTRLSHFVVHDTDVIPERKPHVRNANGIPRVVVLALLATL